MCTYMNVECAQSQCLVEMKRFIFYSLQVPDTGIRTCVCTQVHYLFYQSIKWNGNPVPGCTCHVLKLMFFLTLFKHKPKLSVASSYIAMPQIQTGVPLHYDKGENLGLPLPVISISMYHVSCIMYHTRVRTSASLPHHRPQSHTITSQHCKTDEITPTATPPLNPDPLTLVTGNLKTKPNANVQPKLKPFPSSTCQAEPKPSPSLQQRSQQRNQTVYHPQNTKCTGTSSKEADCVVFPPKTISMRPKKPSTPFNHTPPKKQPIATQPKVSTAFNLATFKKVFLCFKKGCTFFPPRPLPPLPPLPPVRRRLRPVQPHGTCTIVWVWQNKHNLNF